MSDGTEAVRWGRLRRTGAAAERGGRRGIRAVLTVPIAVASTLAVTLGIAQPADAAAVPPVKRHAKPKALGSAPRAAAAPASVPAPPEYVVAEGDTVSGIAERFGLATAEVLAANGLGWSSLIFPGQRLALPGGTVDGSAPAPPPAAPEIARHVVVEGDTVSSIAAAYGLDAGDVLSANGLGPTSLIFPGEAIVLPLADPSSTLPVPPAAAPAPPAEPPTGPAAPDASLSPDTHVVAAGDTLFALAESYGVTVADLDAANALGGSTLIVPGQVLVVRRPEPVVTVASVSVPLTDEMRANARIVIDLGRALGVPEQGIVIALAAAAQESGLRNLHHGDQDSLGLFQQRPSEGWGTPEEVLDP
ncbi:MAG TPA: LysM peptidoglycan-binding domain-containing protein, partial [Agromyces mariniharenae]|nr:LysM peptidoglycan-binding domain-containing protein [Agromyces mariniharenae]